MFTKKILYADDDETGREMMQCWIESANLPVELYMIESVKQAKDLLNRGRFDLLLLDYCFDDGTGVDICRLVRSTGSNVPVVFYSAVSRSVDRQMASDAGGSEYLVKPNDLDKIVPTIRNLLDLDKERSFQPRPVRLTARSIL